MPGPIATAVISSLASEAVRHGTRALLTHGWNLARSVGRQVNNTSFFSTAAKSEFDKSLPRNTLKFSPEHVERLKADLSLTPAQRARHTFQTTPATPGPAFKLKM